MAPVATTQRQIQFIEKIRESVPPSMSFVDELAETLELSTDSAYRRIRGETAFTFDEVVILCNRFKISFDSFLSSDSGSVTFQYGSLDSNKPSFEGYLRKILSDLQTIEKFEKKEIIFAAEDVPIFHHFRSPLLTAFKIFYWNRSILNSAELGEKKFDKKFIDKKLIDIAGEILDLYSAIPSVEIWSDDTLNSTLKQIEFYWESGLFSSKEEALEICHEVEEMISRIKKQAEQSRKFVSEQSPSAEYGLYNCELMIGNNCILVTTGGRKTAYLSYHTFNTMTTAHASFCNDTDSWLKNLIRKSIPISGVAEKQRYQFFKKIEDRISEVKGKIK